MALEVKNISKSYGKLKVLKEVLKRGLLLDNLHVFRILNWNSLRSRRDLAKGYRTHLMATHQLPKGYQ